MRALCRGGHGIDPTVPRCIHVGVLLRSISSHSRSRWELKTRCCAFADLSSPQKCFASVTTSASGKEAPGCPFACCRPARIFYFVCQGTLFPLEKLWQHLQLSSTGEITSFISVDVSTPSLHPELHQSTPFCDISLAEPCHAVCARVGLVDGCSLGKIVRQKISPSPPRPMSGGPFPVGPSPHGALKTVDHARSHLSMPSQLSTEDDQVAADAEASPSRLDATHELRLSLEHSGGCVSSTCCHVRSICFSGQVERR